jgi:hypothetical protein
VTKVPIRKPAQIIDLSGVLVAASLRPKLKKGLYALTKGNRSCRNVGHRTRGVVKNSSRSRCSRAVGLQEELGSDGGGGDCGGDSCPGEGA